MDRRWKRWLMANHAGLLRAMVVILSIGQPALSSSHWNYRDAVTSRKDDNLSVTCTIENFKNFFDVIRIVHIQDSRSQPISDNGNVKLPYSQLPRYSAVYKHSGDIASVTISYRGIEPEDDGRLKCEKLGSPDESSFLNITVLSHVRDFYTVAVASDGTKTRADGQGVSLVENRNLGIGCVAEVDGSVDLPTIRASIDDKDVTSMFASDTTSTLVDLESGLKLSRSVVSSVFATERPNRDFNGKVLKCSAVQTDAAKDTSAIVRVKYAPVIECGGSEWKARAGDPVRIECTVRANPSGGIQWTFASESEEEEDDLTEQENIAFSRANISEDEYRVEMIITGIEDSQFRHYRLKAENDIGTTNVTLAVTKQTQPLATPSRNPDSKQNVRNSNSEPLKPRQNPVIQDAGSDARGFNVSGFTLLLLQGITMITVLCTGL